MHARTAIKLGAVGVAGGVVLWQASQYVSRMKETRAAEEERRVRRERARTAERMGALAARSDAARAVLTSAPLTLHFDADSSAYLTQLMHAAEEGDTGAEGTGRKSKRRKAATAAAEQEEGAGSGVQAVLTQDMDGDMARAFARRFADEFVVFRIAGTLAADEGDTLALATRVSCDGMEIKFEDMVPSIVLKAAGGSSGAGLSMDEAAKLATVAVERGVARLDAAPSNQEAPDTRIILWQHGAEKRDTKVAWTPTRGDPQMVRAKVCMAGEYDPESGDCLTSLEARQAVEAAAETDATAIQPVLKDLAQHPVDGAEECPMCRFVLAGSCRERFARAIQCMDEVATTEVVKAEIAKGDNASQTDSGEKENGTAAVQTCEQLMMHALECAKTDVYYDSFIYSTIAATRQRLREQASEEEESPQQTK